MLSDKVLTLDSHPSDEVVNLHLELFSDFGRVNDGIFHLGEEAHYSYCSQLEPD